MKLISKLCFVPLLCMFVLAGMTQQDSTRTIHVRFGAFYNSKLHYYGRTDSFASSASFAMAELWIRNKFYVSAAPVFIHNRAASVQYAGSLLTAGYTNNNGRSATHFYLVKPVYRSTSELPQSAMKAQAAVNFSKLTRFINLTAGMDIKLSDHVDFGVIAGVDHVFKKSFQGKSLLIADPSVYLYAGTQQFARSRYEKTGLGLLPGPDRLISENVKKFNILSLEFSMPVIWQRKNWMWLITPAYVVPRNLISMEGQAGLSEKGHSMFYVTAGARITI